jgi:hypothetical protein
MVEERPARKENPTKIRARVGPVLIDGVTVGFAVRV